MTEIWHHGITSKIASRLAKSENVSGSQNLPAVGSLMDLEGITGTARLLRVLVAHTPRHPLLDRAGTEI